MPAVRVVDEHLLSPVLVYSGSGGVFENELVLTTSAGLVKTVADGRLDLSVDISLLADQLSKKYINEIVFNENVASAPDQIGNFFNLASPPSDSASVQLWLNGQLLTPGEDYSISNRLITMLTTPLQSEDKLVASYSRPITFKQYAFGERLVVVDNQATLINMPVSSNDVMIFLNGQLLLRGLSPDDNDYRITQKNILFNMSISTTDVVLSTYAYS
jgi:hypothetical protein